MATLRAFRALHYNAAVVSDLAAVIAPPYDVIDDAHWQRLHARNPRNVIRLILNRDPNPYATAAQTLSRWWHERTIVQDDPPALYYYVQNFALPGRPPLERRGLIGAVRLERFGEGSIYPHERTFARAKEDRLRLVEACRTNLSPIFGVYADRPQVGASAMQACRGQAPWIDVTDEFGERHRVWRLAEAEIVRHITGALAAAPVFIADGHHRYETALAYRDARYGQGDREPDAPHNFVLMYLAAMDDAGLVILPTHRVLQPEPKSASRWREQVEKFFAIETLPRTADGLAALTAQLEATTAAPAVGVCLAREGNLQLLRVRDRGALDHVLGAVHPSVRGLGVTVLDALLLRQMLGVDCSAAAQSGELRHTHRHDEAIAMVDQGAAAAFLVRPPSMREVETVCLAGQTMPEKSTYFYPKLLSGLVFHALDDPPRFVESGR